MKEGEKGGKLLSSSADWEKNMKRRERRRRREREMGRIRSDAVCACVPVSVLVSF